MIGQWHDLELTLQNLQKWTHVKKKKKDKIKKRNMFKPWLYGSITY